MHTALGRHKISIKIINEFDRLIIEANRSNNREFEVLFHVESTFGNWNLIAIVLHGLLKHWNKEPEEK
jgi:hypothetical protein